MKFRRTKTADAPDASQLTDEGATTAADVEGGTAVDPSTPAEAPRSALRRAAADETIDVVRGARATDRLRHGRAGVLDLDSGRVEV